jgi:hypothetical protein
VVMVLQSLKVKLMEGLAGTWFSFFPQYFTRAILLGALHVKLPFSIVFVYAEGIKSCTDAMLKNFSAKIAFCVIAFWSKLDPKMFVKLLAILANLQVIPLTLI